MQAIFAFLLGIVISCGLGYFVVIAPTSENPIHPIADPYDTAYHVHADFRIFVEDEQLDLTTDQYMTTSAQTVHQHAHLHDNNGEVKHIHAEGITFAGFLQSLNITLTDSCLIVDDSEQLCSDEGKEVLLYVNEELYTQPLSQYVPVDDDRILLYYGTAENNNLQTYIKDIPNDSCYYSGTCPERGIAPAENCGLTCEL